MTPQEAGRRGGLTTAARYGPGHMARIGSIGFAVTAEKHHGGNRAATRRMLGLGGGRRDFAPTPAEWTDWLECRNKRKGA